MNAKSILEKAKDYYDDHEVDIKICLYMTVFGCICSAFGYQVAKAKFNTIKLGLTYACLADPTLIDHMKEATEKSINIAKQF